MPDQSDDLNLDDDVREDAENALLMRCESAIAGASQRDDDIAEFEDQLEGRLYPQGQPWPDSATLNDSLTREAHMQLVSTMMQATKGTQIWTVEATNDDDADKASVLEEFLNDKWAECELDSLAYDLSYNAAGSNDTAVLFVGWEQRVRDTTDTMYRHIGKARAQEADDADEDTNDEGDEDEEDAAVVPRSRGRNALVFADERIKGREAEYEPEVVTRPDVEHEGLTFRAVNLGDFYLYPANAQSIEKAHGVGERMLLSEDDLLDGIGDYGWDKDKVFALLKRGPTHTMNEAGEFRERQDEARGVEGSAAQHTDGYYDCFLWFGKLPKLWDADGEFGIPDDLTRCDIMAMICPAHHSVFHLARSPYKQRPYFPFNLWPDPKSFYGTGGCRLLANIQDQANLLLQMSLNNLDLVTSPMYTASPTWLSRYGDRFKFYPGAVLPRDEPTDLSPLGSSGQVNLGFEVQQQVVQRGKGLIAAEGYGQLDRKQRKNGEMQNVLQATDAKFDSFMSNFGRTWAQVAAWMVALHVQNGGEGMQWDFRDRNRQTKQISTEDMRGQFRFHCATTAATSSPEMRLNIAEKIQSVTMQYWVAVLQSPPQVAPFLWHTTREVLSRMDVRQPEQCIGPDPAQQPHQFSPNPQQQIEQLMQQYGMAPEQAAAVVAAQQGAPPQPNVGTPPLPGISQLAQAGQTPIGRGAAA